MNYFVVLHNQLQAMGRATVAALPSVAIGILVLVITWAVARFASRIAHRVIGRSRLRSNLRDLIETLIRVAIWLVGFLLAATVVIPDFTFGGMIAGLGIGAVAIGFAFQDIFKNFLAGVLIMLRDKMRIGDQIECEHIRGKVEHISLRETHVRQLSGELTIVPNSLLFEKPVQVITDQPARRDEVTVPIPFDGDVAAARATVEAALANIAGIDAARPVQVFASTLDSGSNAVNLLVRWWVDTVAHDNTAVRSEVVLAILRALDTAGIALPSSSAELVVSDKAVKVPA